METETQFIAIQALEAQDAPLELKSGPWTVFSLFIAYGLGLGCASGAVSGTGIFPFYGTILGAMFGGVAGLIAAIPLGILATAVVGRNRNSARTAIRATAQTTTAFAGLVAGLLMVIWAPFVLPALLPALVAVAYTAKASIAGSVVSEQRRLIRDGAYGKGVHGGWIAAASVAAPIIFWLAVSNG